jgi:hypothetical protein
MLFDPMWHVGVVAAAHTAAPDAVNVIVSPTASASVTPMLNAIESATFPATSAAPPVRASAAAAVHVSALVVV